MRIVTGAVCISLVMAGLAFLAGCTTSTYYPYNEGSVEYYCPEVIVPVPMVIPAKPYYEYDHPNQHYLHTTPVE